jgi:hypothetical protein
MLEIPKILETEIIEYNWVEYKIIKNKDWIKIFYNLWNDEDFEISADSPLYKEILESKNWSDKVKENIVKNTENLLSTYNIKDIKENINLEEENDRLLFYFDENLIWIIKFSFNSNEEIFLEFSWTINAKESDFDDLPENVKNDYLEFFDFSQNLKIRWLWAYIYEEFIKNIKNKNIKYIKSETFNEKIFSIKEKLLIQWIIKKIYKDNDWFDIIEL